MHLINTSTLKLSTFTSEKEVKYAILSHRWLQSPEEEVLYEDMANLEQCKKTAGVAKLKAFCAVAEDMEYDWCWMDTCCIDKSSSAELSEAINSMYRWYRESDTCIAYLADVHATRDSPAFEHQFRDSEWFTRCWTLQELLAPRVDDFEMYDRKLWSSLRSHFTFYNAGWRPLAARWELSQSIAKITRIERSVLEGEDFSRYSIAERMSWASHRKATRAEDQAYSLMGIFDINMPMLYGEGNRAFERLCETIIQYTDDETIFAWSNIDYSLPGETGLFAPSPYQYVNCRGYKPMRLYDREDSFTMTGRGLRCTLHMVNVDRHSAWLAHLNVIRLSRNKGKDAYISLWLRQTAEGSADYVRKHIVHSRTDFRKHHSTIEEVYHDFGKDLDLRPVKVYVRHRGHYVPHVAKLQYRVNISDLVASIYHTRISAKMMHYTGILKVAPECSFSELSISDYEHIKVPAYVSRPDNQPDGPLCTIYPDATLCGVRMIHLAIHSISHDRGLVILCVDEGSSLDETVHKQIWMDNEHHVPNYSSLTWSAPEDNICIESETGLFALRTGRGGSVFDCVRVRKRGMLSETVSGFSLEISDLSAGLISAWSIKLRPRKDHRQLKLPWRN